MVKGVGTGTMRRTASTFLKLPTLLTVQPESLPTRPQRAGSHTGVLNGEFIAKQSVAWKRWGGHEKTNLGHNPKPV